MHKIACIAAHPDDIELGMGGSVSKFIRQDKNIHCIICFPMNNNRREESNNALQHLGVPLTNIHYIDKNGSKRELIGEIDKLIQYINPDTIFTHFHGDTHQDHQMVNQCVLSCARMNKINIILWENTMPGGLSETRFSPDLFIKLQLFDISKKIESFQHHHSQIIKYEGICDFIFNKSSFWGYHIKESHCEVFKILKLIITE